MNDYSLLDSGDGLKLEQFGSRTLVRPSRFATWKKRCDSSLWQKTDATFEPKKGWKFLKKEFETWVCSFADIKIQLRLQTNGQVGIFPEHTSYAEDILTALQNSASKTTLNLFAYTGWATALAAKHEAKVTHVDLARNSSKWTKENLALNNINDSQVRFIEEDALKFLAREKKRGSKYDLIIADPPSFSRVSQNATWSLEDKMRELCSLIAEVLSPQGTIILTSHHYEMCDAVMVNLLSDVLGSEYDLKGRSLTIKENQTVRELPAGFMTIAQRCG